MSVALRKKIDVSVNLLRKFIDSTHDPVLAFGAGRESVTILCLLKRFVAGGDKVRVVISDVETQGMATAQAALVSLVGFSRVEIGPGMDAGKKNYPIGTFPVQPPHWKKGSAETLNVLTNWAEALEPYEHMIVGMRKSDKPPRDQIVQFIGTEAFGYMGMEGARKPKHILFPLADWHSQDLDDYLAIGVSNRMKVMV